MARERWQDKVEVRAARAHYLNVRMHADICADVQATCEVRWLTCWAMGGCLGEEAETRLARLLKVPVELVQGCDNPLAWGGSPLGKPGGIDWQEADAGREWAWVEDGLPEREMQVLRGRHAEDRYYYTNASHRPDDLTATLRKLQARWAPTPSTQGDK